MSKQEERTSPKYSTWALFMAQWQAEGYEVLYQWQRVYERNRPREGKHVAPEAPPASDDFEPSSTGRYRRAIIGAGEPEALNTRTEFTGH